MFAVGVPEVYLPLSRQSSTGYIYIVTFCCFQGLRFAMERGLQSLQWFGVYQLYGVQGEFWEDGFRVKVFWFRVYLLHVRLYVECGSRIVDTGVV